MGFLNKIHILNEYDSNTGFIGKSEIFKAELKDQWWVLSEHLNYKYLDEDIESLLCMCIKKPIDKSKTIDFNFFVEI